jgi:hypothetical protein
MWISFGGIKSSTVIHTKYLPIYSIEFICSAVKKWQTESMVHFADIVIIAFVELIVYMLMSKGNKQYSACLW